MSRLQEAMEILAERKEAAIDVTRPEEGDAVAVVNPATYRLLWSSWGLDYDETMTISTMCATDLIVAALTAQVGPIEVASSAWIDGLLTGLMLAEISS